MTSIIVVIPKERASTDASSISKNHKWVIEGDFGFLSSHTTRSAAVKQAKEWAKEAGDVEWGVDE